MEKKAKIILTRKGEWLNRARTYKVMIDEQKVGIIKNDGTEEYVVDPGKHTMRCTIDWCSSPVLQVELAPDEIAYLKVKSGLKYYWPLFILLIAGLVMNFVFVGNPVNRPDWSVYLRMVLLLPALLYIIYFLTAGRKRYLLVEKDKDNLFG
jgi:hypothetical protein